MYVEIISTSDEKLTPSSVTNIPPGESETNGIGIMCCPPTSDRVDLASLILTPLVIAGLNQDTLTHRKESINLPFSYHRFL